MAGAQGERIIMSSQADVRSIDSLKELRVALALYEEDATAALGQVEFEVKRTARWLIEDRPIYWQEQIKRRREQVAMAKSELFRRKLQERPDYAPPMSEQKENLRQAEASLQEAEKRLVMVRKWQPMFNQAVLEYHGSVQRIKDLTATDVPSAVNLLGRLIDALETYLQLAPPTLGSALEGGPSTASEPLVSIATAMLDEDAAQAAAKGAETAAPDPPAARDDHETDEPSESRMNS